MNPNHELLERFAGLKRIAKAATKDIEEIKKDVLAETKRIIAASDDPDARFVEKEGFGKFTVMRKLKGYTYSASLQAKIEALEAEKEEEIARGYASPEYGEEYVEFREEKV